MHDDWTIRHALDTLMNALYGPAHAARLTFDEMERVAAEVWDNDEVCDLFTAQLAEASETVLGEARNDYPTPLALHIIEVFSQTWNGCPYQQDHDD